MRIFNKFRGTKGWLWLYERQLALARMNNQQEAERRLRILIFWEKHGDEAAQEAFGVSRRTLYRWQRALLAAQGKITGLDRRSTAPKRRRTRVVPLELHERIIALRRDHDRIGKAKIATLCDISESKAGRILSDLKKRGLLPQRRKVSVQGHTGRMHERKRPMVKKLRRPKEKHGLEIDTVVRFVGGTKRYIYTAINLADRFAFAGTYTSHSSATAADFLAKLVDVAPFRIAEI